MKTYTVTYLAIGAATTHCMKAVKARSAMAAEKAFWQDLKADPKVTYCIQSIEEV